LKDDKEYKYLLFIKMFEIKKNHGQDKQRKSSNQTQIIPKNNIIKSRIWDFRLFERKEYMFIFPFSHDKMQTLQRIAQHKRWARVMTIEPNKYNNHSYELIGVIEFDLPQTKNWVQQNVCFIAEWDVLDIPPNVWMQGLKNDAQQNNIIFHDEINDRPYPYD
jgi:hypothetical protein